MGEIITYGKGYSLTPGIKVFVQSAIQTGNKVTIIGSQLGADVLKYAEDNNVTIYNSEILSKKYNVNDNISPYTLKVIYFYLYCKHVSKEEDVYLCDFTDVYFQKNVFELIKNNKPYVTSENKKINTCDTNTTWINICYNPDILNLLGKHEILNGGSILGKRDACLYLLDEMCKDMGSIITRIGNYQNIDQASMNKVVYFDQHNHNILKDGEILNCAHSGNAITKNVNGIYSINNIASHVIHQYDVIKSLEKELYEKYN